MGDEGEITIYGDSECKVCDEAKQDLTTATQGKTNIKYRYVDIKSDEGQHYLEHKGVKPGEKTNVPHIKACKTETDAQGNKKTKCAEVDSYDKEKWKSIKDDKFPELSYVDV